MDTTVEAVGQVALQEQPLAHVGVTPATSTELEGHVDIARGSTNTTEPVPVVADEDERTLAEAFWNLLRDVGYEVW